MAAGLFLHALMEGYYGIFFPSWVLEMNFGLGDQ